MYVEVCVFVALHKQLLNVFLLMLVYVPWEGMERARYLLLPLLSLPIQWCFVIY